MVRPAGRALVRLGLASAGTISFALALVACGQASSQGRGTVSGIAGGCQNPLEAKLQPIVIVVRQNGHVVTKAVARFEDFRSRYRLVLRPGRYTIGDPLSGASPHTVVLHPGGGSTSTSRTGASQGSQEIYPLRPTYTDIARSPFPARNTPPGAPRYRAERERGPALIGSDEGGPVVGLGHGSLVTCSEYLVDAGGRPGDVDVVPVGVGAHAPRAVAGPPVVRFERNVSASIVWATKEVQVPRRVFDFRHLAECSLVEVAEAVLQQEPAIRRRCVPGQDGE